MMQHKGYQKVANDEDDRDDVSHPSITANIFSTLTFWWMNGVFKIGNERPLKQSDFLPLHEEDRTRDLTEHLQSQWNIVVEECTEKGKRPKLWKSLMKTISIKDYCIIWCLLLIQSTGYILQPLLLGYIVRSLMSADKDRNFSYTCSALMAFSGFLAIGSHYACYKCDLLGMRLSSAIKGIVYLKILLLSQQTLQDTTAGQVIDLISNDVQRLEQTPYWLFLSTPTFIEIPVAICLMWYLIGWQSLMGVLFLVATVPSIVALSTLCAQLRQETAEVSDRRISLMDELVAGIRSLKAHAWEDNYRVKVKETRRSEIWTILKKSALIAAIDILPFTASGVATLISAITMVYTGVPLTPVNAFMMLAFINYLRKTFSMKIGLAMYATMETFVSLRRIENLLLLENLPFVYHDGVKGNVYTHITGEVPKSVTNNSMIFSRDSLRRDTALLQDRFQDEVKVDPYRSEKQPKETTMTLSVSGVTCVIYQPNAKYLLNDVTFEVPAKSLSVITGQVGSGKSTLLASLVGEVTITSGTITYSGTAAYVTQTPWIFSGTIRENILFGQPFDEKSFAKVIEACALKEDMDRFSKGDLTFVGERGIVLSGGQRARVSLARAVYADTDIYLLDDPLSAVDAKVGEHIFEQCICGILHGKIRLLSTYSEKHMKVADQVVVLYQGSVLGKGPFSELKDGKVLSSIFDVAYESKAEMIDQKMQGHFPKAEEYNICLEDTTDEHLEISQEDRATGRISAMLYWDYFRAGMHPTVIFAFIALLLVTQVALVSPDIWLSHLTGLPLKIQQDKTSLGAYAGLVCAAFVLAAMRGYLFFHVSLRSSERLHDQMVVSVLQAPVLFFDTNPAGRILNRFSKDVGCVDEVLPRTFFFAIQYLMISLSAVLIPTFVNVWILVVSLPLAVIFIFLARYFLKTSRELRRMESVCRSPVFSHFSETMAGLDTIRSRKMEKGLIDQFFRLQDRHNQAFSMVSAGGRWLSVRADILSAIFVGSVALGTVVFSHDKALAGLALAYVIEIVTYTQFGVRMFSEVENLMTSVERVIAYTKLDQEPGYKNDSLPPKDWPREGSVNFRDVVLRYYPGGPPVLKNLSFDLQGKTKVGIVGRTGDGKSSFVAALLRMPEAEGDILIDGVHTKDVNLQQSRRCISVLSQTPVLFSGSLRKNLTPLDKHDDDEIWNVLEDVQLKHLVENLEGQLDYELSEKGGNFSVGERQLICLAGTLLQQTKIVILDEPTAHVDPNTERTIWNTVNEKLRDSTVITIAHRLNTIRDCDIILVLKDGELAEMDTYERLLGREGGVFHSMAASQNSF